MHGNSLANLQGGRRLGDPGDVARQGKQARTLLTESFERLLSKRVCPETGKQLDEFEVRTVADKIVLRHVLDLLGDCKTADRQNFIAWYVMRTEGKVPDVVEIEERTPAIVFQMREAMRKGTEN